MTLKKMFIAIGIFLLSLATADARTIKVLILDDVFQKIPEKEEHIEKARICEKDLLDAWRSATNTKEAA